MVVAAELRACLWPKNISGRLSAPAAEATFGAGMSKPKPATAPSSPPAPSGPGDPGVPATAATQEGGAPGIDEAQVRMLQEVMRDAGGGFDELVGGFLQQVAELLDELARDTANRNHQLLQKHAHTLRGGSVQMGAVKLAELAHRIEYSDPQAVWDLAAGLLADCRLEEQRVRDYFLFLAAAAGS